PLPHQRCLCAGNPQNIVPQHVLTAKERVFHRPTPIYHSSYHRRVLMSALRNSLEQAKIALLHNTAQSEKGHFLRLRSVLCVPKFLEPLFFPFLTSHFWKYLRNNRGHLPLSDSGRLILTQSQAIHRQVLPYRHLFSLKNFVPIYEIKSAGFP